MKQCPIQLLTAYFEPGETSVGSKHSTNCATGDVLTVLRFESWAGQFF